VLGEFVDIRVHGDSEGGSVVGSWF
jgi:hypothetical protein